MFEADRLTLNERPIEPEKIPEPDIPASVWGGMRYFGA